MGDFWINFILGNALMVIQTVVKNPARKESTKNYLLTIANDIYIAYGMMPPSPVVQSTTAQPNQ